MNSTLSASPTFYLSMGSLSQDKMAQMHTAFTQLPSSEYKDGGYRLRRYSHFSLQDQQVIKLPHQSFKQSRDLNNFQGDVEREYADIELSCYETDGFREMLMTYYQVAGLLDGDEVEIHQFRIACQGGETVETAPEGVHQDGFRRIGVFFLQQENITGGEMKVYAEKNGNPILNKRFAAGEYVILDDAMFWHHTNPITPIDSEKPAFYDVFVITADKLVS